MNRPHQMSALERLPSAIDLEALDWLSRRRAIKRSSVPPKFRSSVRRMVEEARGILPGGGWVVTCDVVLVEITPFGRQLASAYRHGRAALLPGERELVA